MGKFCLVVEFAWGGSAFNEAILSRLIMNELIYYKKNKLDEKEKEIYPSSFRRKGEIKPLKVWQHVVRHY